MSKVLIKYLKIDFNTHLINQNKIYFEENCRLFDFIENLLKINQDLLQKNQLDDYKTLSQKDSKKNINEYNQMRTSSMKKSGKVTTFISRKNMNILKCLTPTLNQQKIIFDHNTDTLSYEIVNGSKENTINCVYLFINLRKTILLIVKKTI